MEIAYISALSALGGSVIGGLTTGLTGWMATRSQFHAGQQAHDRALREELYKEFIAAASRAYGNALVGSDNHIQEIVELHALANQMRILSSPEVIECARAAVRLIIDTRFDPPKSLRDIQAMMKAGTSVDPLREFSETARNELRD